MAIKAMERTYKQDIGYEGYPILVDDIRYVLVDTDTGEIVDDAQGYGYKSAQGAYAAWGYKHRDKSKDAEKAKKEKIIAKWIKENGSFIGLLDDVSFQIAKGSYAPDDKVNAKLIKELLKDNGYIDLPFTANELYKYWNKGPVYSKKKK